jgi:hypothetical protein
MGGSRKILATALTLAGFFLTGSATGLADPGDVGTEGFSYAPLTGSPTQTKPESKVWFADGDWWADLFSPSARVHRIHRLDPGSGQWVDTGTTLDDRGNANSDVLWHPASRKLYVASHVFSELGTPASPSQSGRVYRYSYDPATRTYSLDDGFPVVVNGARSESLTLAMDSLGHLWVAWVQDGSVWANHSTVNDATWRSPYVVNEAFTSFRSDDLAAIVAFGGNRIGIFWDATFFGDGQYYFAIHRDGAGDAPTDWQREAVPGIRNANDHLNVKADRAGRVFAVVKTVPPSDPDAARTLLLRRDPDGRWTSATAGAESDGHTRPIVLLEDPGSRAHVFATCPRPPAREGDAGGDICHKSSSTGALGFEPGVGTPVIQDASSPELNDVTSTKQPVNAATGLVLLANNPTDGIDTYWHRRLELATPAPPPVSASFATAPDAIDPLTARFIDTSGGGATSWLWEFGDGAISRARHGTHRYAAAGSYTVRLTAASATSVHTTTMTQRIPVPPAPSRAPAPPVPGPDRTDVETQTRFRPRVSLNRRYLTGTRVRLYGSVSRRLTGERISLQRRTSKRRWETVARVRLLPLSGGRSRFAFVVRRWTRTSTVRIALPAEGLRLRANSRSMTVHRRR